MEKKYTDEEVGKIITNMQKNPYFQDINVVFNSKSVTLRYVEMVFDTTSPTRNGRWKRASQILLLEELPDE